MPSVDPTLVEALTIKRCTMWGWRTWAACLRSTWSSIAEEVP